MSCLSLACILGSDFFRRRRTKCVGDGGCDVKGVASLEPTQTVTITLATNQYQQVQSLAAHFGVSTEDMVRLSLAVLVAHPPQDVADAMAYVLDKNAELYRRLA